MCGGETEGKMDGDAESGKSWAETVAGGCVTERAGGNLDAGAENVTEAC